MKTLVFMFWLLSICSCDPCTLSGWTYKCQGVTQDEFLYDFFKTQNSIQNMQNYAIEIVYSNFSTIESFVTPQLPDKTISITDLAIRQSAVEKIYEDAFEGMVGLQSLDLSCNKIEDVSFVKLLPKTLSRLDLSNNRIFSVDFNILRSPCFYNFSNNSIATILPSKETKYLDSIDLSRNQVKEFDENFLHCFFGSLDLSTNRVAGVRLWCKYGYGSCLKNIINLSNNNLTSFDSTADLFINNLDLSFSIYNVVNLFKNQINIRNKLTLSNGLIFNLGHLDIKKISFNSGNGEIDLSASAIAYIPEDAFKDMDRFRSLDLSWNNIEDISFAKRLPQSLTRIDLSNNRIFSVDLDILRFNGFYNFSNNRIATILPSKKTNYFKTIDLSRNQIREFHADFLNFLLGSLDLSANRVASVRLWCVYSYGCHNINLSRNNLTSVYSISALPINNLDLSFSVYNEVNLFKNQISIKNKLTLSNGFIPNLGNLFDGTIELNIPIIDLSNSAIEYIPESYFERYFGEVVNLSLNAIKTLPNKVFSNAFIETLDLSYSKIERIEDDAFFNLRCQNLNLRGNKLTTIDDVFGQSRILNLDLSHNPIKSVTNNFCHDCINIPADLPNTLHSLQTLNLNNCKISTLGNRAFDSLTNLVTINLSQNEISLLPEYAFANLPNLGTIDLRGNDVITIESKAFYSLSLSTLKFDCEKLESIKSKAFNYVQNLRELNFSGGQVAHLEYQSFSHLPAIETIDLSGNKITELPKHLFSALDNIQNILLEGNNITAVNNPLNHDVRIHEFNLTFNGISKVHFIANMHLKKLFIKKSRIESLEKNCFLGLFNLEELYFSDSNISEIETGALNGLFNLKYLDSQTLFKQTRKLKAETFKDLKRLPSLNLSNLRIEEIEPKAFLGLDSLEDLRLDNNNLSNLHADAFSGLKHLKRLSLSNNHITFFPFLDLNSVTDLQLNNNNLDRIPPNIFRGLKSLEILNLSNNQISAFESSSFNGVSHLKILDLQGNRFQNLDLRYLMKVNTLESIDLSANQIVGIVSPSFRGLRNLKTLFLRNNYLFDDTYSAPIQSIEEFADYRALEVYLTEFKITCLNGQGCWV